MASSLNQTQSRKLKKGQGVSNMNVARIDNQEPQRSTKKDKFQGTLHAGTQRGWNREIALYLDRNQENNDERILVRSHSNQREESKIFKFLKNNIFLICVFIQQNYPSKEEVKTQTKANLIYWQKTCHPRNIKRSSSRRRKLV